MLESPAPGRGRDDAKVFRGSTGVVCAALSIGVATIALSGPGQAASASVGSGQHPAVATSTDIRARDTGTAILGTSGWRSIINLQAAPSGLPLRAGRSKF